MQTASAVLMVRPAAFGFNPQTAYDNLFQRAYKGNDLSEVKRLVRYQFENSVNALRERGIEVIVAEDTALPSKPDAVFPNNWLSTHGDGKAIIYPMKARNRRLERRKEIIELLINKGYRVDEIIDLTFFEEDGQFLEGTGSVVFDRVQKIAYAAASERTHPVPLAYLAALMDYEVVGFHAVIRKSGKMYPVYHTNVMMHVGTDLAVTCLDAIPSTFEKMNLKTQLENSGKKIIPITVHQKMNFCGNMLELINKNGERYTVMSETAYRSLRKGQIKTIERCTGVITPDVSMIESLGGGSIRCMLAEIFLPVA
ncbi:citrulline utilization hydrolase CtlX [Negadavirga shengliensis]|uniref:Citrulline utilization hydrolase CtlX n=1 Tax=Negadavirga shengliensis TaxID=1389218 RepID=A0ABV9T910_9BACT